MAQTKDEIAEKRAERRAVAAREDKLRAVLVAEMRVVSARLRLDLALVDATGAALSHGLMTPDEALRDIADCGYHWALSTRLVEMINAVAAAREKRAA